MEQYSPTIKIMLDAMRNASRKLVRDFGEVENLQVSRKGPGDFVSAADLRAERIIMESLERMRPGYSFLSEESGITKGENDEYRWIIDPLDGTTNFLHGFSLFCSTIALERKLPGGKREIVAAVTESPILGETFWAEKGEGAWLEDHNKSGSIRLRVGGRTKLSNSLVCVGSLSRDADLVSKISSEVSGVRCIGSTALALAYVAAGRYDAFISSASHPWDMAAGTLILREATGCVSAVNGTNKIFESKSILAANSDLNMPLVAILRKSNS